MNDNSFTVEMNFIRNEAKKKLRKKGQFPQPGTVEEENFYKYSTCTVMTVWSALCYRLTWSHGT